MQGLFIYNSFLFLMKVKGILPLKIVTSDRLFLDYKDPLIAIKFIKTE
jgi:hypothetical protein